MIDKLIKWNVNWYEIFASYHDNKNSYEGLEKDLGIQLKFNHYSSTQNSVQWNSWLYDVDLDIIKGNRKINLKHNEDRTFHFQIDNENLKDLSLKPIDLFTYVLQDEKEIKDIMSFDLNHLYVDDLLTKNINILNKFKGINIVEFINKEIYIYLKLKYNNRIYTTYLDFKHYKEKCLEGNGDYTMLGYMNYFNIQPNTLAVNYIGAILDPRDDIIFDINKKKFRDDIINFEDLYSRYLVMTHIDNIKN